MSNLNSNTNEVIRIERDSRKPVNSATYKQYEYLRSFSNVDLPLVSRFTRYISKEQASDAISLAKSGYTVEIDA